MRGWICQKPGLLAASLAQDTAQGRRCTRAGKIWGFWGSCVCAFPAASEQTWALCTSVLSNLVWLQWAETAQWEACQGPKQLSSKWPNHEIFPLIWISCMRSWFCMSRAEGLSLGTTLWRWNISSDLVLIFQVLALANLLNSSSAKLPSRLRQMALDAQPKPKKNLLCAAISSS